MIAGIIVLSSCTSGSDASDDGCRDADQAVVDQAMSLTKSNFTLPDGTTIDRLKFDDAATYPLPADQQKFGATKILALRLAVFFGGEEAGSAVSGVETPFSLALGADDELIAPLGSFSEPYFDLATPSDPGWSAWAEKVDASKAAIDASGCVNPNLG